MCVCNIFCLLNFLYEKNCRDIFAFRKYKLFGDIYVIFHVIKKTVA